MRRRGGREAKGRQGDRGEAGLMVFRCASARMGPVPAWLCVCPLRLVHMFCSGLYSMLFCVCVCVCVCSHACVQYMHVFICMCVCFGVCVLILNSGMQ